MGVNIVIKFTKHIKETLMPNTKGTISTTPHDSVSSF